MRNVRTWLSVLAVLLLLSGCSEDPQKRLLQPYSNAVLAPGVGLGDLELGETTLSDVVDKLDQGFLTISITDEETVIELAYLQRQLCLGFTICGTCKKKLDAAGKSPRNIGRDLNAFMTEFPDCRRIPLTSISVGGSGFYQGATDKGVKLGSPLAEAEVHKSGDQRIEMALAGSGPRNGDFIAGEGIVLYHPADNPEAKITRITVFKRVEQ